MDKKYDIGTIVEMKKKHACQANKWLITRVGVDIKLQCLNCGRIILLDRLEFEHKLRRIISEKSKEN